MSSQNTIREIFLHACETGIFARFENLLNNGLSPDIRILHHGHAQPLLYVAYCYSDDMVSLLIEKGADVQCLYFNSKTRSLDFIVQSIIEHPSRGVLKLFLDHGFDITMKNPTGVCTVKRAIVVYANSVWRLKDADNWICEEDEADNEDDEDVDDEGNDIPTILRKEANRRKSLIKYIINHGLNLPETDEHFGTYAKFFKLMEYIFNGQVLEMNQIFDEEDKALFDFIRYVEPKYFFTLIDNPDIIKRFLEAELFCSEILISAMHCRQDEIVEMCINNHLNSLINEEKLISQAIDANKVEYVRVLTENLKFSLKDGHLLELLQKSNTSCHNSLHKDTRKMLDYLLNHHYFDINRVSAEGLTMLQYMAHPRFCHEFAMLLEKGALLKNPYDKRGKPISHKCYKFSQCNVLKYFRKYQLLNDCIIHFPNQQYMMDVSNSITPEELAEYEKELEKMKIVLDSGMPATKLKVSIYGFLCLDSASASGYLEEENLERIYNDCNQDFRTYYPHFGSIINGKFIKAKNRKALLDGAHKFLCRALGDSLKRDNSRIIFNYINNRNLKKLNK